jgi:DNA-binding transcriptional ArsR family regulator
MRRLATAGERCNHSVVGQGDEAQSDRVFAALGDATRRDILRRAALGEHSVTALAAHYEMSFAAVQKHVAVLERAGLIRKRPAGRQQLVSTDVRTVGTARQQLETLETVWRDRLDRFGDALADLPREQDR